MSKTYKSAAAVATAETLNDLTFPIVMAPYNGVMTPFILRELNQVQIRHCGDFSLIETIRDKLEQKSVLKISDEMNYFKKMYAILKAALVSPTFDEIMAAADERMRIKRDEIKKELLDIEREVIQMKRGTQRSELEKEIAFKKMQIDYILPDDFVSFVVSYALGINKSDIKAVTESMLIEAAILAKRGNDNPADHVAGNWPENQRQFYRDDINRRAYALYDEKYGPGRNKKRSLV